jgi:hypothetical protein
MTRFVASGVVALSLLLGVARTGQAGCGSDPGDNQKVIDARADAESQCGPCAAATNHGVYVSCVAGVANDRANNNLLPKNCKGKVKKCAAKSTCGKPGFVTCLIPTDTCVDGTCSRNQDQTCTTDANCGTRCHIRRSAQSCTDRGGTVGAGSSCCAPCL